MYYTFFSQVHGINKLSWTFSWSIESRVWGFHDDLKGYILAKVQINMVYLVYWKLLYTIFYNLSQFWHIMGQMEVVSLRRHLVCKPQQ